MIVETKNGLAFASNKGLAMTQKENVDIDERRYILERERSMDKTFDEDVTAWREAEKQEVEEWRAAWRRKLETEEIE